MNLSCLLILVVVSGLFVGTAHAQEGIFAQEFNMAGLRGADAVAVDSSDVYVAGGGTLYLGGGVYDGFLRKFGPGGSVLWSRRVPQGIFAMAVSGGRVYVLGKTGGGLPERSLFAFDADGNELWNRRMESANRVVADATGVYVTGGGNGDGFLHHYSLTGDEVWTTTFRGRGHALTLDDTGVYWGGLAFGEPLLGGFLQKRSRDGLELWTRPLPQAIAHLTADATGVYVLRRHYTSLRGDVLEKFDSNGTALWTRPQPDGVSINGMALDSTDLYLAGAAYVPLVDSCLSGYGDGFVQKFDASGVLGWSRQFSASKGHDRGRVLGVAINQNGVYVAGHLDSFYGPGGALLATLDKNQPAVSESGPWISSGCVVNAASLVGGRISREEIVSIIGYRLGSSPAISTLPDANGRLATSLANTRVLFDGVPAPLLYVSEKQINAIVPEHVGPSGSTRVEVEHAGIRSNVMTMPLAAARPGIFTRDGSGGGPSLVLNQDGTLNSKENPAVRGSTITFFVTGAGNPGNVSVDFCCFSDQSWPALVESAGAAPVPIPGLLQIRAQIPDRMYLNQAGQEGDVTMGFSIGGRFLTLSYLFIRDVPREP